MDGDPFETVAIAYSQSQVAVLTSLFAAYGIPLIAMNVETLRANPAWTLALGGFPIRVPREAAADARGLLTEAAETPDEDLREPGPFAERVLTTLFLGITGLTPPPRRSVSIVGPC
jgi:hypothetical protein